MQVYDHRCNEEEEISQICAGRTNGTWEVSDFAHPKHLALKELKIIGFSGSEEHIACIGAVMERASNLHSLLLKDMQGLRCN